MSRSYYAAYSFLAAALVLNPSVSFAEDREGPQHEPLSDLVASHLKHYLAPTARSRTRIGIRTLYEARLIADYRPRAAVSDEKATLALQYATEIANNVRKIGI